MEIRRINVNLQPHSGMTPRITLSQYDVGVPMEFELTDGAQSASLPSGCTAKVHGTRPSGVGFSKACAISGNVLSVTSSTSMTGEYGNIPAEVVIEYSGNVIGSGNFILVIEESPHKDGTIDSEIIIEAGIVERVEDLETAMQNISVTDPNNDGNLVIVLGGGIS